jgi:hypothetical protein
MKYVIWNKTRDMFYDASENEWSNRFYATKYTYDELETVLAKKWFGEGGDLILAVIAVNV